VLFYRKDTITVGPQGYCTRANAYHLRQKSPLHFASLLHIAHSSKVNWTLVSQTHNFRPWSVTQVDCGRST